FAVSSGSLPMGLTLNPNTGVITGAPTTAIGSPFAFTISATDSASNSGSQSFAFTVNPPVNLGTQAFTLTTLATFGENTIPLSGVIEDSSGNLFGTTYEGGDDNNGSVFEVQRGSGAITTLASFDATNGDKPEAGVIEDNSGNLFGTTFQGGAFGVGTVFEVPKGGGITTLASFDNTNGRY